MTKKEAAIISSFIDMLPTFKDNKLPGSEYKKLYTTQLNELKKVMDIMVGEPDFPAGWFYSKTTTEKK